MLPQIVFSGSPIVSPQMVTTYFGVFLVLLVAIYLLLHQHIKPIHLHHRLALLLGTTLALKLSLGIGSLLVALYWLVPAPQVVATSPTHGYSSTATKDKIEIVFDRPITRQPIQKSISPEAEGMWVFEEPAYSTHLYYKLVFYPTFTLRPGKQYTVSIQNVKNLVQFSDPIDYEFSFTTESLPEIVAVTPEKNSQDISIQDSVNVFLSHSPSDTTDFDFEFSPPVDFEIISDNSEQNFVLKPKENFQQGTNYQLKIYRTPLEWDLTNQTVFSRNSTQLVHETSFTTQSAPGIEEFSPSGKNILVDSKIAISFDQAMDQDSVRDHLSINPSIDLTFNWLDDQHLELLPDGLEYNTRYQVKIDQGTRTAAGGFLEEIVEQNFSTIGHIQVAQVYPGKDWSGVDVHAPIKISFDQPVNQQSALEHLKIIPEISYTTQWQDNTLIIQPHDDLDYSTTYEIKLTQGIESLYGLSSIDEFKSYFSTQHQITKLSISPHLQEHALSCEVATLKMALAYRDIQVPELTLLDQVGYNPAGKQGNVWGDPYQEFVGDVNGKQMRTGYGVYWEPIANAARNYRQAEAFSGWRLEQVTQHIANNNPVIVWGYSKGGIPSTWFTPDNREIYAISGEHTFLVTGFVGPINNPVQIILNDPLIGEVYMSRSYFEHRWGSLGNSGVVVY